jgi:hypothetical protein
MATGYSERWVYEILNRKEEDNEAALFDRS